MKTAKTNPRGFCPACLRSPLNCYCRHVRAFDPGLRFAILIHAREARKHVATGRLAHLSLKNSLLLRGYEFHEDPRLLALLDDPLNHCVVLFPGEASRNLTRMPFAERAALAPAEKQLVVLAIDGTWATARKAVARNKRLASLPRISFDPPAPSRIRLREQPHQSCLTTLEAIHHTIELLGPARGFDVESRAHDSLLHALDAMVDRQISLGSSHNPAWWAARVPAAAR